MTEKAGSRSIVDGFKGFLRTRAKRRLNEPKDMYGDTLLHRACYKNDPERVQSLLEKGADPNVANIVGNTPLRYACSDGHPEIVRLLLDAGADVGRADLDGITPLDAALDLPFDNPAREEIMDLFRQYAPEIVMEAYCSPGPRG